MKFFMKEDDTKAIQYDNSIEEPVSAEVLTDNNQENIQEENVQESIQSQENTDNPINTEELEDTLFFGALDYASSPEKNYLSNIQRGSLSKERFFEEMRKYFEKQGEDSEIIDKVLHRLETYIWGYYIIEQYINDPSVSDIKIYDADRIRLKRNGKRLNADAKFHDVKDYLRFVDIVCSRNKVMLSDINAILKFTDASSNPNARLRFNITSGFINSTELPVVHIRKVPKNKATLEELSDRGMFPKELIPFLRNRAKTASGIVWTGKGASGKTTLMNAMMDEIPYDKSGCVIQEADELFSDHPDIAFEHVVLNRGESKIQYTLKDLATNGLLTDLDYFIIGEIKGDEAAYFMNAAYTGHQCWTSVHGVNSQEAINKLVDYVKYATDYPRSDVLRMLRFMKTIIFMKNFSIDEISEIVGIDDNTGELKYNLVYKKGKVMNLPDLEEGYNG